MRNLFKKASSFALATIIALTASGCNFFNNDKMKEQVTNNTNKNIESTLENNKNSKLNNKSSDAEARKRAKEIAEKAKAKVEKTQYLIRE